MFSLLLQVRGARAGLLVQLQEEVSPTLDEQLQAA